MTDTSGRQAPSWTVPDMAIIGDTAVVGGQSPAFVALLSVANSVRRRIISEQEAIRQARQALMAINDPSIRTVINEAYRIADEWDPEIAYTICRLLVEAVAFNAPDDQDLWRRAAIGCLQAGCRSLIQNPDGSRFQETSTLADAVIRSARESGSHDDLAGGLFLAARLRLAPFIGGYYGGKLAENLFFYNTLRGRPTASRPVPDTSQDYLPDPVIAARSALNFLREAASHASGNHLSLILTLKLQTLVILRELGDLTELPNIAEDARTAIGLVEPAEQPERVARLALLIWSQTKEGPSDSIIEVLLNCSLVRLSDERGIGYAIESMKPLVKLAKAVNRYDVVERLVQEAVSLLPEGVSEPVRMMVWSEVPHVLPGNKLPCDTMISSIRDIAELLTKRASGEGWTNDQLAASLLHLAAHSPALDQEEEALRLLSDRSQILPRVPSEHTAPLRFLRGQLRYGSACNHGLRGEGGVAAIWYARALADFSAVQMSELVSHCLERLLKCAVEDDVVQVLAGYASEAAWLCNLNDERIDLENHDFCASLSAIYADTGFISSEITFALHQVAKGLRMRAAKEYPVASNIDPQIIERRIRDIYHAERNLGVSEEAEGKHDYFLDEQLLLGCFIGAGESSAGVTPNELLENHKRAFDHEMLRAITRPNLERGIQVVTLLGELQPLLSSDTVLISTYLGYLPNGKPASYICAIARDWTHDSVVQHEDLEDGLIQASVDSQTLVFHPIADVVAEVRRSIVVDPLHRPVSREAESLLSEEESVRFLGDLPTQLDDWQAQGKRHLRFWPHGPLHFLPYHLLSPNSSPLADAWTISVMQGFSSRPIRAPRPLSEYPILAIGCAVGDPGFQLTPEPAVEIQATKVAEHFGQQGLIGPLATKNNLLSLLPRTRYAHIAAHGASDSASSLFHCLYLHPEGADDGRVCAYDLLELDLAGVELVTLSACESALGRFDINDNLSGIPGALLMAGVSAIVGASWPVNPDVASSFFLFLYEELSRGTGCLAAFRAAQVCTRSKYPRYRDWGAFVFITDRPSV